MAKHILDVYFKDKTTEWISDYVNFHLPNAWKDNDNDNPMEEDDNNDILPNSFHYVHFDRKVRYVVSF